MKLKIHVALARADPVSASHKELSKLRTTTDDLLAKVQLFSKTLHGLNITDQSIDYSHKKLEQSFPTVDAIKDLVEQLDPKIDRLVSALNGL